MKPKQREWEDLSKEFEGLYGKTLYFSHGKTAMGKIMVKDLFKAISRHSSSLLQAQHQKTLEMIDGIDIMLAMVQSTTEDTPHDEIVNMIGNIRTDLKARLEEM